MRPCLCDRLDKGQPYDLTRHCRLCWMYHHDARANAEWGGGGTAIVVEGAPHVPTRRIHGIHPVPAPVAVPAPKPRRRPCKLRGPEIDRVLCPTCSGKVELKVFSCPVHSRCTAEKPAAGAECCRTCPDYVDPLFDPGAGRVRHLLFHLWPTRGNDAWRWHIDMLRARKDLFNGRRICAVVTDDSSEPASLVRDLAGDVFDEFLEFKNDPKLREVATFEALFSRVESTAPGEAFLWAHSKGVGRNRHAAVHRWTESCYALYCDHWPAVQKVLQQFPVAGALKKLGKGWDSDDYRSASQWHYSGSWCWYRSADLFARPDWRRIDRFWSGIEPYPSLHFPADEAGCIFWEGPASGMNLYDAAYWDGTVTPALERWLADRRAEEVSPPPPGLKVELGGGRNPRGAPWLNVDREPGPGVDFRCDLETDALPFGDETVGELYSAHCFEHVANLKHLLREVARVCKAGAKVEIRVPHWLSPMAMCHDHKQVIPPEQVDHWCRTALDYWWAGSPRRFRHVSTEQVRGGGFGEAKALHPGWSDEQLMKFVPGAAHEVCYRMEVVDNV